jgi:diguanylate cyclase (GGDEF)-like protein
MNPAGGGVLLGSAGAPPPLARYAQGLGTGLCILLGLALLIDYGDAVLRARQAITDLPFTSKPVAAASILLVGLAGWARPDSRRAWRVAAQSAIGVTLLLLAAHASDHWLGTTITDHLLPFGTLRPRAPMADWPPLLRTTATTSLLLLALGQLLRLHRAARAAQLLLAAAAGFLLALLGYAAQAPSFRQPMALFVGLAGMASVLSVLAAGANTGFLAELAGDRAHSRLTRQGIGVSTVGVLLIGGGVARLGGGADAILVIGGVLGFLVWIWVTTLFVTMRFNVTERQRRAVEADLRRGATIDGLTGLLNRNKMDELIAQQRSALAQAAMIMIDIDRFRSVNNGLGTEAGDSLLVQAANRLSNLADPHRVARAGGDEFAIFCNGIGPAVANRLAQAVVETMAVPFRLADGRQFHITASVGIAHGATGGIKELRYAADEAMYIAKNQGGNQSVPFVSAMHQARVARIRLEQDLHRAFKSSSELFMVYQPIISLRDRRVVAIEALARWQHPQLGLVPPGRFVGIAESSGMFLGLGSKLRALAVAQAARWRDAGWPLPVINLNVSPLELARSDVPGSLGEVIDRHGLQRGNFCLEVTEGSFADERALHSLQTARDAGYKIAMDDFGVGYSSLTQLPRLPLTSVKLDRSFLDQAMENEDGISLLATMVQLAHVLKLPVVAEGVETSAELSIVSDCGCDSVQGFLFSEPLTAEELGPWLRPGHKARWRAQTAEAPPAEARPAEALPAEALPATEI